jgi:hypothetical protein
MQRICMKVDPWTASHLIALQEDGSPRGGNGTAITITHIEKGAKNEKNISPNGHPTEHKRAVMPIQLPANTAAYFTSRLSA